MRRRVLFGLADVRVFKIAYSGINDKVSIATELRSTKFFFQSCVFSLLSNAYSVEIRTCILRAGYAHDTKPWAEADISV